MENMQPEMIDVCILIPCYNNLEGLVQSINSIVYHKGRFIVLVVDDGSKVPINNLILHQQVSINVNIQILRLARNEGISIALNKGLDLIYASYAVRFVARLDCGDTCYPERFFRQVSFLENNPDVDLLGSWCFFKDPQSGAAYQYITPTRHEQIKRDMHFRNVFIHPAVVWRVSALNTYRYPVCYPHAEDYGLFYDIVSKKRTAILGSFLVTCQINKQGISVLNRRVQLKSRLRVIWHYGENKFLIVAGTIKLLVLIALPYRFIYRIKKWLYKSRR